MTQVTHKRLHQTRPKSAGDQQSHNCNLHDLCVRIIHRLRLSLTSNSSTSDRTSEPLVSTRSVRTSAMWDVINGVTERLRRTLELVGNDESDAAVTDESGKDDAGVRTSERSLRGHPITAGCGWWLSL